MVRQPKQAIALLVHNDIFQINSLIKKLEKDFDLYIHVDKKCDIDPTLIACKNVWKEYKVHWGSYDIVQSTLFLYRKILSTKIPYTHVILLSADSLPIKSNEYIYSYLSANAGTSFMENIPSDEAGLDRRRLIWYKEDLRTNVKGIKKLTNPFKIIRWLQKKLNINRSTKGFERTGSQWTILALLHVQHLIDYGKFSKFRFTAIPDESFVQNHFDCYRLPFSTKLIYAHWPNKRSFSPHFVDEATCLSLVNSPFLFARKFDTGSGGSSRNTIIKSNPQEKVLVYNNLISDRFRQSKPYYD
jgi:hypothetical protein